MEMSTNQRPTGRTRSAAYQLFPPLSAREYQALKADIAERGVLVPVELDQKGEVLDGHHRLAIAEELGIKAPTVKRTLKTDAERSAHIIALNLMRRNLDSATWGRMFKRYMAESATSMQKAAKRLGVPRTTAREADARKIIRLNEWYISKFGEEFSLPVGLEVLAHA